MTDDPDGLLRVQSLHALEYCERLFYLEEVEDTRRADEAVFAGRALHEQLRKEDPDADGEWTSREVTSEALGLTGKVDALRRRDGVLVPYEHKRGRPHRDGKAATAWPSDALQVAAYTLLLEEESGGAPIPEARIRYHAENITVRVPVDETMRQRVREAIARARTLRSSLERPPVTSNDRLCLKCSLAPVCLPEEDRFATDGEWEPVRLFPPERDLHSLHVVEPGARVGRSADTLTVELPGKTQPPQSFPVEEVGAVVLHGNAQISTQAIHLCASRGIGVHFLSAGGKYVTAAVPDSAAVQRRIRQYRALTDPDAALALARRLARAKIENTLRYLLRSTAKGRRTPELLDALGTMRKTLSSIATAETPDAIRGHEGLAARAWFAILPTLLRGDVPGDLMPTGRNRRPPRDRFNALLSFGYALLYQHVLSAIRVVGLEPALGFYHTPRSSAHPLVLDLMELFRLTLWDIPLVGSLNRLHWNPETDFQAHPGRVWLTPDGRRKAIRLFEARLEEHWKHPVLDYSLTYARLTELEVRLLEKEWTDHPGLFARMRVR
jgi:CRISPR-associated protein Cas1